jgi:predicted aspartyl protease
VQQKTIQLTSRDSSDFVWVPVQFNGTTSNFLLDTGTSFPIVSSNFVSRFGFETYKFVDQHEVFIPRAGLKSTKEKASLELRYIESDAFSLGSIKAASKLTFAVIDTSAVEKIVGGHLDGFVGGGLLNGQPYAVDFRCKTLSMGKLDLSDLQMSELAIRQNLLYVEIELNGMQETFFLDSGALQTEISKATAAKVLPEFDSLDWRTYESVSVLGERLRSAARARIRSFSLGGTVYSDVEVVVAEQNVLGIDFLRHGVLVVDPINGTYSFSYANRATCAVD